MRSAGGNKAPEGKRVRRETLSMMTRPETIHVGEKRDLGHPAGARQKSRTGEALAQAVGKEVRTLRLSLGMSASQLARATGLSNGMLSKVERGSTTPSFASLATIANALSVPVARLFASQEQRADYSLVRSGKGIPVRRHGAKAGYYYELLGHLLSGEKYIEPYLVTLTCDSSPSPGFQHTGIEFMYILEGSMVFRYADSLVELYSGDSLVFDANSIHGHERLLSETVRYLSVVFNLRA
jgi:transcriptional regulator with XRE-family HTH domain